MANLIDTTYFINHIHLPVDEISAELTTYITKYEPEILTKVLGYELYAAFAAALAGTPATKWTDLRDGKDYDISSITYHYRGLKNTAKESLIANYVFYKYSIHGSKFNSSFGIKQPQSENSLIIDPSGLQADIYNEMVDWIYELNQFIVAMNSVDATTYPNYIPGAIRKINKFN